MRSYVCGQLICDERVLRLFNGERIVLSTNDAGTTGFPHAKECSQPWPGG